jgi:hypothetical protein
MSDRPHAPRAPAPAPRITQAQRDAARLRTTAEGNIPATQTERQQQAERPARSAPR